RTCWRRSSATSRTSTTGPRPRCRRAASAPAPSRPAGRRAGDESRRRAEEVPMPRGWLSVAALLAGGLGPALARPQGGGPPDVREYAWVRVTARAGFAPRDGAGALVFGGRMWLLGGWNPGDKKHFPRTCNNEVWSSTDGAAWRLDKANSFLDQKFDPQLDW